MSDPVARVIVQSAGAAAGRCYGAAMPEILYDRVIKFSPRAPAQAVTLD
jgi:hypothetical protein